MRTLNLNPVYNTTVITIALLFLILNYGFMVIKIPPGIPIGQFAMVFLLTLINHRKALPAFINSKVFPPFIVWLTIGLGHVLMCIPFNGFLVTIRDASHHLDSIYLYIGFAFAADFKVLHWVGKKLPIFMIVLFLYSLTYPLRSQLVPLSPKLAGSQGQEVSLLFNHVNTFMVMLVASTWFFVKAVDKTEKNPYLYLFLATLNTGFSLILFPTRTMLLQLLAVYLYIFGKIRSSFQLKQLVIAVFVPMLLIGLVGILGIKLQGRQGEGFELFDYFRLFTEIFYHPPYEDTISSGNTIRYLWWAENLTKWMSSVKTFLFGLGYGVPLVDFVATGSIVVREPHNDWIGVLTHGGLFVFMSFVCLQVKFIFAGLSVTKYFKGVDVLHRLALTCLFIVIFTIIAGLGESPMIMSFFAIPYYLCAGILVRMDKHKHEMVPNERH